MASCAGRERVTDSLEGGAKAAHRWLNGPIGWAPQYGAGNKAQATDPDSVIEAIRGKRRLVWQKSGGKYRSHTLPVADRTALPRLTVDEIRAAGRASSKHKATAYDGIHRRHIGNSSE